MDYTSMMVCSNCNSLKEQYRIIINLDTFKT